jgi:hypothetical protein
MQPSYMVGAPAREFAYVCMQPRFHGRVQTASSPTMEESETKTLRHVSCGGCVASSKEEACQGNCATASR